MDSSVNWVNKIRRYWAKRPLQRTDVPEVSDELAALISALGENREMQQWFSELTRLPDNLRVSAVGRLVSQMSAAEEDPKAIQAFQELSDASTCRVVARVLQEHFGVKIPEN